MKINNIKLVRSFFSPICIFFMMPFYNERTWNLRVWSITRWFDTCCKSASHLQLHDRAALKSLNPRGKPVLAATVQVQRRNNYSIIATCHQQLCRSSSAKARVKADATMEFLFLHLLWQQTTWLTAIHKRWKWASHWSHTLFQITVRHQLKPEVSLEH